MNSNKIIAIASSTGGPKALQQVIPKLPKQLHVPILLVQHMPSGFTQTLADRLDEMSELCVVEAKEGMEIQNDVVYVAKGGKHLAVGKQEEKHVLHLTDEEPREGVKPCANYMYESLIDSAYQEIICVVMTGMGADGTEGIAQLKKHKKTYVITQDEASCTVYGMPKSAIKSGLSDKTVSLEEIANEIINSLNNV